MAEFFAASAGGNEGALARELNALGMDGVQRGRGGVTFFGYREEGWRACLHSRIATRVQMVVGQFPVSNSDELYDGVKAIDWESVLTPRHTLSVSAIGETEALRHTGFTALRTKDAVVDRMREAYQGRRASVDSEDPDLSIVVYLGNQGATIYADMAGVSLHKRGYRVPGGEAPLRETLAASLLAMVGYDGRRPFHDPFCGSGTIAIEAALIAWNIAPGLLRQRFGFERWASFDHFAARTFSEMREAARMAIRRDRQLVPAVYASDIDPAAVARTEEAAALAGVPLFVRVADASDMVAMSPPGVVLTNPPWGERMAKGESQNDIFATLAERLGGHTLGVLSSEKDPRNVIDLNPRSVFHVRSGPIEGSLGVWDL